jgi:hypothetical protein
MAYGLWRLVVLKAAETAPRMYSRLRLLRRRHVSSTDSRNTIDSSISPFELPCATLRNYGFLVDDYSSLPEEIVGKIFDALPARKPLLSVIHLKQTFEGIASVATLTNFGDKEFVSVACFNFQRSAL